MVRHPIASLLAKAIPTPLFKPLNLHLKSVHRRIFSNTLSSPIPKSITATIMTLAGSSGPIQAEALKLEMLPGEYW